MDRGFLDIFHRLPEVKERDRISLISKLLPIIEDKQGNDEQLGEYLDYAVNRLLKGVQSTRKFARLGFSTALTQLLRSFPQLTVSRILHKIELNIDMNKAQSKSDKSNVYLGRLMAYLALIQSGKIRNAEEGEVREITEAILKIKVDKVPLHQTCTQALVTLVENVSAAVFDSELWPVLEEILLCGWEKCTADILWLLIETNQHQTHRVDKKFLLKHWNAKQILSEKNADSLASIIIQSTSDHPIIHPLCMKLLHKFSENNDKYTAFWTNILYQRVFTKVKGSNCKYLLFQLIPEGLKLGKTPEAIYSILSPKLVACLMKYLSNKDSILHSAAKHLNQELIKICVDLEAPLQVAMVMTLVTPPGTVIFDNVVKTKSVQTMTTQFSMEAMVDMTQILMKNIRGEVLQRQVNAEEAPNKHQDLDTEQKWSTNVLRDFVNQTSLTADISWATSILEFLFLHAFFDIEKSSGKIVKLKKALDHSVKATMKIAFCRAQDKMSKCLAKGSNGYQEYNNCLSRVVQYVNSLLNNDAVKPTKALEEETRESWEKMVTVTTKMRKNRVKVANDELAFELLFLHYGLQLLVEAGPAREILDELHTCYKKAKVTRKQRSSEQDSEEPQWVDVIVDLLMSLLSQKSHLVRSVVSTVFTMICPHLTRDTLQLVLDVLKPGGDTDDNALDFEEDDDSEESEEEENDEDEGIASGTESEKSESESDSGSSSESGDEAEARVDDQMRSSVKAALGRALADSEDDDDDHDLDDDAMMKLDKTLSAAFRQMTKSKKADIEKEIQLKHYRMRVLDVLEVIINHSTAPSVLLDLIVPLLNLMDAGRRDKAHQEVGQRAARIYSQLVNMKKLSTDGQVSVPELLQMLRSLIQYSTKVSGIPMIVETSMACVFVLRVIQNVTASSGATSLRTSLATGDKRTAMDEALGVVRDQLTDFCVRRDCRTSPKLFLTMLEKEPGLFWPLADTILEHMAGSGMRLYSCTQMTAMLTLLLNKSSIQLLPPQVWKNFSAKVIHTICGLLDKKEVLKGGYQLKLIGLFHCVCSHLEKETRNQLVSDDALGKVSLVRGKSSDSRRIINKLSGCFPGRLKVCSKGEVVDKKRKRSDSSSTEAGDSGVKSSREKPSLEKPSADLNKGQNLVSIDDVAAPTSKKKHKKKKRRNSVSSLENQTSTEILSTQVENGQKVTKNSKKKRKQVEGDDTDTTVKAKKKKAKGTLD